MERRHLDFHDFGAVGADVDNLRQRGYRKLGNWTLSQVCQHLGVAMRAALDGGVPSAPWLFRKLLAGLFFRRLMKTRIMPTGIKVPKVLLPGPPGDEEAAIKEFQTTLRRFQDHQGDIQPHPFFGPLTREQHRQLHLIHCGHHLSFLIPND
jgi:hypothetical protein